jgi:hypothetical protein
LEGQQVRISWKGNLGSKAKEHRGRFVERGVIVNCCDGNSYLVRNNGGRLVKKRYYDLKEPRFDIGETPFRGGDVIKGKCRG